MTYFEVFIEFPDDFTVLLPFFLSWVGFTSTQLTVGEVNGFHNSHFARACASSIIDFDVNTGGGV